MPRINNRNKWLLGLLIIFLTVYLVGCQNTGTQSPAANQIQSDQPKTETGAKLLVEKGQNYSTEAEVAAYIHEFHVLPPNYITKTEATKLGWDNTKGNLWQVTRQKSIGGDRFGNYEGLLPEAKGRQYYECDINYAGGYRGSERIIYSNDGLVFYTADHYKTFTQLY